MSKFNPSPKTLVVNELIEKGYTVDYDDALRLCHELEEEERTDGKIAIALAAVGIIGAGVTLAFCGAVAPLLVPIAAIGVGMSGVWNHPIRATRRDDEADFLRANPSIVPIIEAKLQSDEAPFKITSAYAECFRSWQLTGQLLVLPAVGNSRTIAPLYPTDEEIKEIGNTLIDRLKVSGRFAALEQIGQRVKAGDIKGGLKMAISANGLNAASFLDAFPGKAHVFDWANDAMAAVIPTAEKEQTIADYIETTKPSDRDVEGAVQFARSQPTTQSPDSSQWAKPSAIAINPTSVIGNTLSSLLLIAPTGAGKGILVSNLIRHFHKSYAGLKVFAFEGKNDQNETGYWAEGFEQVARVNLDICDAIEAARAISWIVSQVDQSHGYGSPSILLVDEANTLITVLENGAKYGIREDKEECGIALGLIKKKISTAASTGNSAQKYVWVIGQNPNLTALGLNGGDANQLRKIAIALYSNPVLTDQITLNTGYTGKKQDASYRSVIDDLIECSPVDRAFYDSASAQTTENKGWFPMDKMINYSGYDRDSRKHIGNPPQSNTVATAPSNQEYEEAESNESYTMPEAPSDRVKLAAKLVQESRIISADEVTKLVPGLAEYLPTVVLFYSECTRKGEVYKWVN